MCSMVILTQGSDLTLAPTLRPWVTQGQMPFKQAVTQLAKLDFRALQLDATLSGIRPRDLDQRSRKDLLAVLTRSSMQLAGLDCFIPRKDFISSEHVDRAVSAVLSTIQMAADLGRVPVSLALPIETVSDEVKSVLLAAADGQGVALAIHAEDQIASLVTWVKSVNHPLLGLSLDPASLIASDEDPVRLAQQHGQHLTVGRLCDYRMDTNLRCSVGQGALDVSSYRLMLDMAKGRSGPVVLDLRGMEFPPQAAIEGMVAWDDAAVVR
ncbi:MAG: sugar phosphate isomerase/epimerase [Phycisphaeraceae bacterium]|nr:sugar phosphate isomerase/epimerase [Phycisphaeraceae bacterium]